MSNTNDQPGVHKLHDLSACKHWGQGGSYAYDPATKQRTRLDGTTHVVIPAQSEQTVAEPKAKANNKEKAHG
ncbi:hypothetical protein GTP44_01000 [Duganella sp. FT50W]|uniref:Uncharacterized protein n=1 Tax=Duganella lactea TaxID=2692173 RepID=A0A6L8MCT6_9BURK|nr:hypothetical protein [Duganella lactea]MYM80537.1 hypothetical protein [Duganella lactea]